MGTKSIGMIVKEVIAAIRNARRKKEKWAMYDFVGTMAPIASRTIQGVLHEMGYVAVVRIQGGLLQDIPDRLYVDLMRSKTPT